jgi:hypothetical protein
MSRTERKLAAALLKRASDVFGDHSCNDFDMTAEAGLTEAECARIHADYEQWNSGGREEPGRGRYAHDFALMGYLAAKLEAED